jgi:hypothetical protein
MSRVSKTLALATGLALWTGPALAADDVDAELAEMRRMVEGLQQKVDAQEEQLAAQGRNLEEAQEVVRRTQADAEAVSGLSSFLNSLEVDGVVAVSYNYNLLGNPDKSSGSVQPGGGNDNSGSSAFPAPGGLNQGASGSFYAWHGDHDTFQVDQVWFGMGKPASEESRAGFRFDILYGQTATYLGNGSSSGGRANFDSLGDFYVNQAYIEYLAPIGDGVTVMAGKFGTLAGAEVAKTTDNFNVTAGNLYNLLQPIDHYGVLVSTDVGPVSLTAGAVNSQTLGVGSLDDNSEKTLVFQAGIGDDDLSGAATVFWGAEAGSNKDDLGIFDVVITANPSDTLSMWLNIDYVWADGCALTGCLGRAGGPKSSGGDKSAWGIAAAGRLALTDSTGFALRAEYVHDSSGLLGLSQANPNTTSLVRDASVWGITATVDHTLVDSLLLRLETRYDRVDSQSQFFNNNGDNLDRDQWVLLAQAVYVF